MDIETLKVQAHTELEQFIKNYAKKYKLLFKNGFFGYHILPSSIPEIDFPYDARLEIRQEK
jgi:hypothetical protein